MKIGRVTVAHAATLAPMEEHTSPPFRQIARRCGASLLCTERIDAVDVAARDRRALRMLATSPAESPCSGQISGADPAQMAEAGRVVEEHGFAIVDLNFECPIRRLIGRGEGGALMQDPAAIERIVAAVVRAVSVPVTLKIRSGPDAEYETATEVATRAEQAGAAAIIVHARSVQQGYAGGPEWSVIERVRSAVLIPVIGSGGIREPTDAARMLRETGAHAVAIGRGCLGNPWIFQQTRSLVQTGSAGQSPSIEERGRILLQLVEAEFRYYGTAVALRRLPRTACYFAKFVSGFDEFKSEIHDIKSLARFRELVRRHFRPGRG
jgi:tRNA-dihydrouridine synthase B